MRVSRERLGYTQNWERGLPDSNDRGTEIILLLIVISLCLCVLVGYEDMFHLGEVFFFLYIFRRRNYLSGVRSTGRGSFLKCLSVNISCVCKERMFYVNNKVVFSDTDFTIGDLYFLASTMTFYFIWVLFYYSLLLVFNVHVI